MIDPVTEPFVAELIRCRHCRRETVMEYAPGSALDLLRGGVGVRELRQEAKRAAERAGFVSEVIRERGHWFPRFFCSEQHRLEHFGWT